MFLFNLAINYRETGDVEAAIRTGTQGLALLRAAGSSFESAQIENDLAMLKACIFTNSPDEHFLIDVLPDAPQVSLAAGFSGHGYKFCSLVGEVMADLAVDGRTRHDIGLFSLDRFAG